MRIVTISTLHRRAGPHYYIQALRRLGHDVLSVAFWKQDEPWGTRAREPDLELRPMNPPHIRWSGIQAVFNTDPNFSRFVQPDCVLVIDGGEDLRVIGIGERWAHISTEGSSLQWSIGLTPHRYAEIMCNGADPGVKWLPKACDPYEMLYPMIQSDVIRRIVDGAAPRGELLGVVRAIVSAPREYDLVQLASARDARRQVWQRVRSEAPDLNCVFTDQWGPIYACAYQNALATYACSTLDFVTTRVFEAMAAGCIVFADLNTSIQKLFTPEVHFVGYRIGEMVSGEGVPDVAWLVDQVRKLRTNARNEMRFAACMEVLGNHTYEHRARRVLSEMGFA